MKTRYPQLYSRQAMFPNICKHPNGTLLAADYTISRLF